MSEKICKHLIVKQICTDCNKKHTKRIIVKVDKNFLTSEVTEALQDAPEYLNRCVKCKSSALDVSYSFYHKEKIKK